MQHSRPPICNITYFWLVLKLIFFAPILRSKRGIFFLFSVDNNRYSVCSILCIVVHRWLMILSSVLLFNQYKLNSFQVIVLLLGFLYSVGMISLAHLVFKWWHLLKMFLWNWVFGLPLHDFVNHINCNVWVVLSDIDWVILAAETLNRYFNIVRGLIEVKVFIGLLSGQVVLNLIRRSWVFCLLYLRL